MEIGIISNVIKKNSLKRGILEKASRTSSYFKTPVVQKVMNNLPCFFGPIAVVEAHLLSTLNQTGNVAQNIFVGGLAAYAVVMRQIALQGHREAVKGAAKLGAELKEKGLSSIERKIVIKDHLSGKGNIIFSKLFKLIYPKRVQKLAEGIETKSGFIG